MKYREHEATHETETRKDKGQQIDTAPMWSTLKTC